MNASWKDFAGPALLTFCLTLFTYVMLMNGFFGLSPANLKDAIKHGVCAGVVGAFFVGADTHHSQSIQAFFLSLVGWWVVSSFWWCAELGHSAG